MCIMNRSQFYFIGILVISISILIIYRMTKKNVIPSNHFRIYGQVTSGTINEQVEQISIIETKHEIQYEETPQTSNKEETI